ncbi:ESPR-type extended signal peptide-containing protein [uncultured Acidaminococcus sp.]|uniref:ESPR-type extended signal peptide-containing protein n=2 Tax=uncultured Acidaminococcus sp. TaxID=352152 RepID=UPI002665B3B7|nr:ESPR-type extended signal peptide-containing protein [uncultured Acidaminococcus sp.]
MNKIYKVIWNKTRGMYMVVSELAKGQSKDGRRAVGRKKVAQTAAALAVFFSIVSMGGTSYAAGITIGTATVTDSSGNTVTVFTGNSSAASAVEAAVELTVPYNSKQIGILQDAVQSVEDELAQHQNIIDNLGTDKLTLSADNTLQKESYDSATKTTKKTDVTGLKVTGPISAESGKLTNSLEVGHNANVGGAVNAGSLNSRGNLNVDGNALVKGTLTSQSTINGNEIVSQTNITAKNKVVGMQGVVDNTLTSGNYVTAGNTVGENIVALDTQAKANADAIEEEARKRKYSVTNLENADKQLQTNIDNEAADRKAADNELNERITNEANAIHETTNKLQDDLSTETTAREAADTALDTRITNVKEYLEKQTSDNYVSKADAAVQDGAVVKAANTIGENVTNLDAALAKETAARIGADAAQDKVIEQVNQNMVDGFNTINKNMADGFTALNQADANEAAAREAADTTLQTNIDNEAAERKAADTVLDDKITAETSARVAADTKLVEAVNSGVSLSDDNVLQKNTTTIDAQGNVTTSKTDANEMILNKGKDNQITLNENGIKVGTNSTVVDKDGVYTGGDTYSEAKAAMSSDGSIKGANGKFTVDSATGSVNINDQISLNGATGAVKANSLNIGDGNFKIDSNGAMSAANGSFKVDSNGAINAAGGNFKVDSNGGVTAANGKASIDSNGKITSTGLDAGNGTIQTTGTVKAGTVEAGTVNTGDLNVTGKATVKDLDVTGEFNAKTLNSKVDANNYTTITGGNVTSKNFKMSDDSEIQASSSTFNEKGSTVWARDDESKGTSTVTADSVKESISDVGDNVKNYASRELHQNTDNKYEITDSVVEDKNSNVTNKTATQSESTISDGSDTNKSTFRQKIDQILQEIKSANGSTTVTQTDVDITNTAKNGTITNDAQNLVNKASSDMTNTIGGKMLNDVTGDMENKVGGNLINTVAGNMTSDVTGDSSLTAENINNTAKNKITNKALDVETDASSSIVSKVSNEYGSNTSTQLSYQTTEEMSQADGKKASYLRGAAEEKSQLTDGDKKTTIDTIAGQTNTNITDGTNTSNNLQKADQVASSVTDGTNTTVVNQDVRSIASSITDGTKSNTMSNTVDGSAQQIKASDTQYSATSKTATKTEEALVNGSTILDVVKDSGTGTISAAVTDGTNTTGSTMTASGITNTTSGDISNSAANISNTTTGNMTNTVGGNLIDTIMGTSTTTVTGKVTEDYKSDLSTKVGGDETHAVTGNQTTTVSGNRTVNVKGTETENFNALETNVKTDQKTSVGGNQTTIVTGNQTNNVSGSKIETVKGSVTEKYGSQATTVDGDQSTNIGGNQTTVVAKDQTNTVSGNKTETVKGAVNETYGSQTTKVNGDQSTTVTGKQTNSITGDQVNTIGGNQTTTVTGDSSLSAKNITHTATEKLSNSAAEIENVATTSITSKVGNDVSSTMSTTSIVDKVGKTTVTTTDGKTKLTNEDGTHVTEMDYAEVMKDLGVRGSATIDQKLTVKGDSDLQGNATVAGDVSASSYKVGDKTYIDQNGINANSQKVTNVANGDVSEGSTDAVNGGQLHATNQRVSTVEKRMDGVENRVDNLDNRIDKVGASAAAMANLHPMDFDEDSKVSVAAAVGSYRSETAGALGVFYRPTDRVMMNVSTSFGNGENMVGGGVSFKLGKSSKRLQQAEATNAALSKQVANLQNRLNALLGVLNPNLSKAFPDVPANHWAYEAVSKLAGNDIVQGYEDGKYHGERTMSRYEMAEIIYNALSKGAKAEAKLVEEFRPELQAMAAQRKA